ncbi:hypothetical protein D9757_012457 [Collybiopsis confluens]|uniref:Neutral trehalase Ca2+ binding domain-containing protein n=1 Tax=Collybiopsis confluens TaxID=2823264 RepID=A0A8H5FYN9_9AGAR|nr:hypothetical protein D9757_012457 [Collybiopsis confluens]
MEVRDQCVWRCRRDHTRLEQEDADGDFQISVTDAGPKVMALGTATSSGFKMFDIRGTYMLSNLLQELALARDHGRKRIVLDEARLTENPVERLSGLEIVCADPKNRKTDDNLQKSGAAAFRSTDKCNIPLDPQVRRREKKTGLLGQPK